MSQHDYNLADASGASFRTDANLLFLAIASLNSGSSAPATTFANMGWFDTANNLMKVRKEDDSGWITVAEKTATEWNPYHGTVALEAAAMDWTGDHDFAAQLLLSGVISPAQITTNQNNYNPSGLSGVVQLRLNSNASRNITGLAGGATGRLLMIANIGSTDIVLVNQSGSSTAGNRFLFAGGDRTLTADESVLLRYDGTSSRWRAAHDVITGVTRFAAITTTSGTTHDFTGLAADLNRITVMLSGVSLSGSDELIIRIGDAGGFEATNYISTASNTGDDEQNTTGFLITRNNASGDERHGLIILSRQDGNTWVAKGSFSQGGGSHAWNSGGKTLSAELDRIQIATTGSDTFDLGSVSIITEI